MICNKCNNTVPNDSEYCPFCGNIVTTVKSEKSTLVTQGYTYLELKKWKKADQIFETAIVSGEDKAHAYMGKVLAKAKCADIEILSQKVIDLNKYDNFKMALKYADEAYKTELSQCFEKCNYNIQHKSEIPTKRLLFPAHNFAKLFYVISVALFGYFSFMTVSNDDYIEHSLVLLMLMLPGIVIPLFAFLKIIKNKILAISLQVIDCLLCVLLCFGDVSYFIAENFYLPIIFTAILHLIWFGLICFSKRVEAPDRKVSKWKILVPGIAASMILITISELGGMAFCDYNLAKAFYKAGSYEYANEYFNAIGDYKDSIELAQKSKLQEIKNTYKFEEIELDRYGGLWYVVSTENDRVLLVKNSGVTNNEEQNIFGGWENSSIRKYLNGEFYETYFDDYIKERIVATELVSYSNPDAVTVDKIFIFDKAGIEKHYPANSIIHGSAVLRNVNITDNIYSILDPWSYSQIQDIKYTTLDINGDGKTTLKDWQDHVEIYGFEYDDESNEKVESYDFYPAMWIDISGLE